MYKNNRVVEIGGGYPSTSRDLTTNERIDSQILFHEKKLAELKELKDIFEKEPNISRAMELMTSGII
ncbi:MAG: hypothetical protein AB7O96_00925 [Pseudobdellovibrionaceae bacterium]